MTARDFCFWLQSTFEVAELKTFNEKQTELIRRHLALVFKHEIDPTYGDATQQAALDAIHSPPVTPPKTTFAPTKPYSNIVMKC